MTAVANCLSCGVAFLTAVAWYQHLETVHRPSGELVCVLCGMPYPRALFATHPCVGEVFSTATRPPLNGETGSAARPALTLVSPSPKGDQP